MTKRQCQKTCQKDLCTFKMNDYVIPTTKVVDGKEKIYYERHPIATYATETAEG